MLQMRYSPELFDSCVERTVGGEVQDYWSSRLLKSTWNDL